MDAQPQCVKSRNIVVPAESVLCWTLFRRVPGQVRHDYSPPFSFANTASAPAGTRRSYSLTRALANTWRRDELSAPSRESSENWNCAPRIPMKVGMKEMRSSTGRKSAGQEQYHDTLTFSS